jgi:beta-glucanase (GH16 family)
MKPYKILLVLFLLISLKEMKAQIPSNDPAWVLQTSASEEFNSALDTVNKWRFGYAWGHANNGAEWNFPSQLTQTTTTTLKITADTMMPGISYGPSVYHVPSTGSVTYVYKSGAISTRPSGGQELYKFGYIEGRVKVPTSYYSYWPALWLFSKNCTSNYYNEVDFCEPAAPDCYAGNSYGTNIIVGTTDCNLTSNNKVNIDNISLNGWYKYAVEWAPDRMNFYFNDALVRSYYDATGATIPQNPMMAIVNFCVFPWYANVPSDWNALPSHSPIAPVRYPATFEIDWLRYYKLNTACGSTLTICNPATDYNNRPVQQTISTGGSCSPTFSTSSAYTLRATNDITLGAGTTVTDDGSGYFAIIIQACPQ